MKAKEFKEILKPLIEQTVKEVLFESGVLSRVVSEVARGLNQNIVSESSSRTKNSSLTDEKEYENQRQERIRRLNESSGMKSNVFENLPNIPQEGGRSPLAGVSPGDSGVDISAIQKLSSGKWKLLAGRK